MRRLLILSSALAVLMVGSWASAATYSFDFNTDQSSQFTVVEYQAAGGTGTDSSINWTYDYSTHVQLSPATDVPIPSAPSSGDSSTIGVRMDVNLTAGLVDSLTLFPNLTAAAGGDWTMTFDVWANHNGDAGGDTGSTEFWGFGAANDNANPNMEADGDNGFNYYISGDAGAVDDARYASGAGTMATDFNAPDWWASATPPNDDMNNDADWTAFFPNDGTNGTPPTGTVLVGGSGKQWITVKLVVSNGGADRQVYFKRSTDSTFTLVSSITGGTGSSDAPSIGYLDLFSSVANPAADEFVVFDNLSLDIPPSAVPDWELF